MQCVAHTLSPLAHVCVSATVFNTPSATVLDPATQEKLAWGSVTLSLWDIDGDVCVPLKDGEGEAGRLHCSLRTGSVMAPPLPLPTHTLTHTLTPLAQTHTLTPAPTHAPTLPTPTHTLTLPAPTLEPEEDADNYSSEYEEEFEAEPPTPAPAPAPAPAVSYPPVAAKQDSNNSKSPRPAEGMTDTTPRLPR